MESLTVSQWRDATTQQRDEWLKQGRLIEGTISILESNNRGFKVVCSEGEPSGGADNGNWLLIADGLNRAEAVCMQARLT